MTPLAPVDPGGFPPLERVRIENLACSWPAACGLGLTHWSARSLQQEVIRQEIRERIHFTTVARILAGASLQPHRFRYWKTPIWEKTAIRQAARVLWCYERVDWLRERNILVVCLDEKANLQVLERAGPVRPMVAGQIEQQEFEYLRHGTVNFLAAMTLHDGQMWGECVERNDGQHFREAVLRLLARYAWASGVYLVMDNGPSHIAGATRAVLAERQPWVRVCFTPARASWLNQAELLLRGFGARYLDRGHWESRQKMIEHLEESWPEYNACFAHRFFWSWTRSRFRDWVADRAVGIPCITSATVH